MQPGRGTDRWAIAGAASAVEKDRGLGSCCRVWPLDVEDGRPDAADSHNSARSSFGPDRLSVDQARRDVDEVALAHLGQLAPQARTRPSAVRR